MTNLLDDDAELEVVRADLDRGEGYWRAACAEFEINKRLSALARWHKAISVDDGNHPRLPRAREIVSQLEGELDRWRLEYLRSWCGYRKPN
jgi:hypothetical protein